MESESLKLFEGINEEKLMMEGKEEEKKGEGEEGGVVGSVMPEANLEMKVRMIPMNK